jgi:hypothetical protein
MTPTSPSLSNLGRRANLRTGEPLVVRDRRMWVGPFRIVRCTVVVWQGGSMSYEAPKVKDYGTLVQLTAGQTSGNFTDKDFPVHTFLSDLTFSS